MSKLLIAALLAVFSTSVLAEWTMVGGNDTYISYADLSTIRKSGDKVKMWNLFDYKVVQIDKDDGTRYLSQAFQQAYDCKEETAKLLAHTWYSKNMGAGEVVYSSGVVHREPDPISPGSIDNTLFKVACGK